MTSSKPMSTQAKNRFYYVIVLAGFGFSFGLAALIGYVS